MGLNLEGKQVKNYRILGGMSIGTRRTASAVPTEATVCLFGLRWALQAPYERVVIFTDSKRLVELLLADEYKKCILFTFKVIRCSDKSFNWCCINNVDRDRVR